VRSVSVIVVLLFFDEVAEGVAGLGAGGFGGCGGGFVVGDGFEEFDAEFFFEFVDGLVAGSEVAVFDFLDGDGAFADAEAEFLSGEVFAFACVFDFVVPVGDEFLLHVGVFVDVFGLCGSGVGGDVALDWCGWCGWFRGGFCVFDAVGADAHFCAVDDGEFAAWDFSSA